MSARPTNPCTGHYAGCTSDPPEGRCMCPSCARTHADNAAARRAERKAAGKCSVCGKAAFKVEGARLSTCKTHREYYRARSAAQ